MPTIKKQMRNLSREMSDADFLLKGTNYKGYFPDELARMFEEETSSVTKGKYAQAYILSKYGENARNYAKLSADYVEAYGLDESSNPYLKFLNKISNNGSTTAPSWLNGEKVSTVVFTLVDNNDSVIDDDRFYTFLKGLNSEDDDFTAYYIQAVSWITNPEKMKDFNPKNPKLEDTELSSDQVDAKKLILGGNITDKNELTKAINTLGPKRVSTAEIKKNTRKEENQDSQEIYKTELLAKFDHLTANERNEFKRIAKQLGIDLKKLGLEYA